MMTKIKKNCEKKDAEFLLLGAKAIDLDEYPNLKYIFRAGVGCDQIPIEGIQERGIELHFPTKECRDVISMTVAKFTLGWILAERSLQRTIEEWYREPVSSNKVVLIVGGAGHVGSKLMRLCQDVGIRSVPSDPKHGLFNYEEADIVTFHVPLVSYEHGTVFRDNRNLISKDILSKMKKDVVIINTSRGGIANEEDIAAFLKANPQAKYITDVYQKEPYTDECVLSEFKGTQFFGTPHIGSYSEEVREALTDTAQGLIDSIEPPEKEEEE